MMDKPVMLCNGISRKYNKLIALGNISSLSDGGTLRGIVQHLAAHIEQAKPVSIDYFSPSPGWVCRGDLWGYGADMALVRDEVASLLEPETR